jgi:hypothetical protein
MGRSLAYNLQLIFVNWKFVFTVVCVVITGIFLRNTGIEKSSYFSGDAYDPSRPVINQFFVGFILGFIAIVVGFFVTGVLRRRQEVEDQVREFGRQCELMIHRLRENGYPFQSNEEQLIAQYAAQVLNRRGKKGGADGSYWELRGLIFENLQVSSAIAPIQNMFDTMYQQAGSIQCTDIKILPNSLYTLLVTTILLCVILSFPISVSMYGWVLGCLLTPVVYVVFIGVLETARSYHPGDRHSRHEHPEWFDKYIRNLNSKNWNQ